MENFILIFICLISGILIRKYTLLPRDSYKSINMWILYIALPAVSFKYIPQIIWNKNLILPILTPLIVWSGAFTYISIFSKIKNINSINRSTLIITCGLCNTSFLGFPMVAAYFGENNLNIAVIIDQINFLIFSSFGLSIAIKANNNQKIKFLTVIKKVFKFPPFIGFLSALIIPHFIDLSIFIPLFDKLSNTVSPLALFSIGLQLNISEFKDEFNNLSIGLLYKLMISPILIYLFSYNLNIDSNIIAVSIFESAMPSLVSSYLIIDEYNLNTKLASLMIGLGIILCFFTTFLIYNFLTHILKFAN